MSFNTPPPPPPPPGAAPPPPPPSYGGGFGGGSWQQPVGPKPPNYLVWAILSTLFCCLPFGIVSIVYAAQVDSKYNAGTQAGAVEASNNATRWAVISAVVALALTVLWVVLAVGLSAGS